MGRRLHFSVKFSVICIVMRTKITLLFLVLWIVGSYCTSHSFLVSLFFFCFFDLAPEELPKSKEREDEGKDGTVICFVAGSSA